MDRSIALPLIALAAAAGAFDAAAADLMRYVGKYPFDKVGGRSLYQLPELKKDFVAKFGARRSNTLSSYQTAAPIEAIEDAALGKLIVAWQCKPHDCQNNATVILKPDGAVVGVCFAYDSTRKAPAAAEWLGPGWRVETKDTGCGDDAKEQVARFKAAAARR